MIAQYLADLQHNSINRLSQILVPTLITVGSFDLAAPVQYALQVRNEISESEMVVWENGGHLHNIENPKDINSMVVSSINSYNIRESIQEIKKILEL